MSEKSIPFFLDTIELIVTCSSKFENRYKRITLRDFAGEQRLSLSELPGNRLIARRADGEFIEGFEPGVMAFEYFNEPAIGGRFLNIHLPTGGLVKVWAGNEDNPNPGVQCWLSHENEESGDEPIHEFFYPERTNIVRTVRFDDTEFHVIEHDGQYGVCEAAAGHPFDPSICRGEPHPALGDALRWIQGEISDRILS